MAEPTGLEFLARLLADVKGFAPADPIGVEHYLPEDTDCHVPGCSAPAVFQCTGGYLYCAHHAGRHGFREARHEMKLIPAARREQLEEARQILEARVAHPELEPDD